jgi:hypothetical protein
VETRRKARPSVIFVFQLAEVLFGSIEISGGPGEVGSISVKLRRPLAAGSSITKAGAPQEPLPMLRTSFMPTDPFDADLFEGTVSHGDIASDLPQFGEGIPIGLPMGDGFFIHGDAVTVGRFEMRKCDRAMAEAAFDLDLGLLFFIHADDDRIVVENLASARGGLEVISLSLAMDQLPGVWCLLEGFAQSGIWPVVAGWFGREYDEFDLCLDEVPREEFCHVCGRCEFGCGAVIAFAPFVAESGELRRGGPAS